MRKNHVKKASLYYITIALENDFQPKKHIHTHANKIKKKHQPNFRGELSIKNQNQIEMNEIWEFRKLNISI